MSQILAESVNVSIMKMYRIWEINEEAQYVKIS